MFGTKSDAPKKLISFLKDHKVAHLATSGDGGPHSAPVFYALIDGGPALAWLSATDVLHSLHIDGDTDISVSIAPSNPKVTRITGVQMRGSAHKLEGKDGEKVRNTYLKRHPGAATMVIAHPDHRFYLFTPTWARLIDRPLGIDRNEEWTFSQ